MQGVLRGLRAARERALQERTTGTSDFSIPPMSTLSDIELRRCRHETIRAVIGFLARAARSPRRVGLRVLLLDFALQDQEVRGKQKELAARLGLTEGRTSKAIADLSASLDELRK